MPEEKMFPHCNATLQGGWWICSNCRREYNSVGAANRAVCGTEATPSGSHLAAPQSDAEVVGTSKGIGTIAASPDGESLTLSLTADELADLANRILQALAKAPDLEPTVQVWLASLFLTVSQLKGIGVPATEIMQIVTVAWNGDETGMFVRKDRIPSPGKDGGGRAENASSPLK